MEKYRATNAERNQRTPSRTQFERDLARFIDTLDSLAESVASGRGKLIKMDDFLTNLRQEFGISRIYYPGARTDRVLEGAFNLDEIYYLDRDYADRHRGFRKKGRPFGKKKHRQLIANTYNRHTFQDNAFDAIFFEDNHASVKDFKAMLNTLKPGGIVIMGFTCMGEMTQSKLRGWANLEKVELPYHTHQWGVNYAVYQKRPDKQPRQSK